MAKRQMTAEQKQAAAERLAKAREKRLKENPPEYKNISKKVQSLPEDHTFSMQNVKEWIKTTQDKISSLKVAVRQNVKGAAAEVASLEGYVRNMRLYLDGGDWVDSFYGADMEGKVKHRCLAMAYNSDGTPKRTVGVFYDDIGVEWTKEMDDEARK